MKQWKRLAALSSAIVMAAATLTYFPSDTLQNIRLEISASAETTTEPQVWIEDNLTWKLYADGTLTISGTGAMKAYDIDDSPATQKKDSVKAIVIEDGITSIGDYAFWNCTGLTSISIPNNVTSIGSSAFESCSQLASIEIPSSVTSIGDYAFSGCSGLTSVNIPEDVTSIGERAFMNCSQLAIIEIPKSVTSIGKYAFSGCSGLTSITILGGVTSIGDFAFSSCSQLASIEIPSSVTSIGNSAFWNCTGLTSITIPNRVTSIGNFAFRYCRSLASITIPDSVTSIGVVAFDSCTNLKTISLSCKSTLKKSDFGAQANLVYSSHTLNKTEAKAVTCAEDGNIEYWTCEHCGKYFLSDDTNPETATAVEQSECMIPAIQHKNAITRGAVEPTETEPGYSGDRYCPDCDTVFEKGYTYWNEGNLTWKLYEDGTLNISGTGAMKDYNAIDNLSPAYMNLDVKKIVIEEGVTSIGTAAFSGCGLISITIPDSVTSIGESAFEDCSNLTSITIPDSVTSIEYCAFSCCGLTSITIPDSVTSIGSEAFSSCFYLKTISLSCKSSLKKSDFGGQADLVSYTSHTLKKTEAKDATCSESGNKEYWTCEHCGKHFLSDDTNPETAKAVEQSETVIPASHKLTKVEAKDATCSEDGNKEYWTCEHCKKYFLSDDSNPETAKAVEQSETVIPASHKLTKVEAKDATCTEDGNTEYWTCEHCKKYFLSDDTNPETATAVEQSETILPAIQHKNAELRNSSEPTETSPGYSGDLYCPDCDKVVEKGYTYWIEDNLTWKLYEDGTLNISGTGAMKDYNSTDNLSPVYMNSSVKKVVIEEGVTNIGNWAFSECSSLTSITIPDSVTNIGAAAFDSCGSLTSITIPGSVTSIGTVAFYNCSGLTSITIPDSVTNIGAAAFDSCGSLTSIVIPNSVTSIESYAFSACSSLTSITIPDSVTSIGNNAFDSCSSLTSITIPDGVTSIESYAFCNCSNLTSITIPDGVTSIEGSAFYNCSGLTSITIPDSVTSIESYAFYNCSGLTSITIPDSVTNIGAAAFDSCTSLKTISLSCKSSLKRSDFGEQVNSVSYASHTLKKTEAKAATYAENGNKAYWTCEHCGKYFLSDDSNSETAKAVELSETVIPALVQVATATTPIKCVYGQDMNKIDLRDYVKNTDVVGEVSVKVATGSALPDGMKLDGSNLSGKPAKAYEDGKEVTFTFTAENGSTENLTLLFLVEKADPTVEVAVSGDLHTEGDLVSELELILSENSTKGVVELVSEIKALVAGKNTLTWKFTPEDENNYHTVTGTVVVNAQTTTTTITTTKATTTTTKATTTTKPNKTTTTNATTTTKPSKTTTTKVTTTTKPNKTTTTNATTTTKPSKTTTTKATTTTKPSKTTTTKVTTTTKPSKATTTKVTTTTTTTISSYGDVNLDGKVDIVDAIFLNKYLATLIQFSDAQMANADCYQDGVLNDQDTTALMQFIILLIDDLPVQPTEK